MKHLHTADFESYRAKHIGNTESDVQEFIEENRVWSVTDPYDHIVEELYEYENPGDLDNHTARDKFTAKMLSCKAEYGEWFYFPWSGNVVRYPEEEDFYNLRTSRNRNLITDEEQSKLYDARIAAFGMSVGSNVVDSLVQHGIGRDFLLADYDTLSPTNLNRIRSTMGQVGLQKTVIVGRKISESNPFANQVHLSDGYTRESRQALKEFYPDIIVEEMDDLNAKYDIRLQAAEDRVPVVMAGDIGEKAIIDVERYDLDENTRPFHGRLESAVEEKMRRGEAVTAAEKQSSLVRINRLRNLSSRLISSALDVGKEVGGMPQLGTTATIGGALATTAIQEILLDRRMASGSYVVGARHSLKGERPDKFSRRLEVASRYINHTRSS